MNAFSAGKRHVLWRCQRDSWRHYNSWSNSIYFKFLFYGVRNNEAQQIRRSKIDRIRTLCCRISKISNSVGRNDNFFAKARKLSILPTSLDIFDIRQHYIRIRYTLGDRKFYGSAGWHGSILFANAFYPLIMENGSYLWYQYDDFHRHLLQHCFFLNHFVPVTT